MPFALEEGPARRISDGLFDLGHDRPLPWRGAALWRHYWAQFLNDSLRENGELPSRKGKGSTMPLDPLAKRLLTMMAAAAPQARSRPSVEAGGQSMAKRMQFARSDAPDVATSDGMLPGPGGALPYRLYSPAGADDRAPGFVFFHGGGLVAGSIAPPYRIPAGPGTAAGCP